VGPLEGCRIEIGSRCRVAEAFRRCLARVEGEVSVPTAALPTGSSNAVVGTAAGAGFEPTCEVIEIAVIHYLMRGVMKPLRRPRVLRDAEREALSG
jgi:hypothetical protein